MTIRNNIRAAWHALRGKPTIHEVTFHGGITIPAEFAHNVLITNNTFLETATTDKRDAA